MIFGLLFRECITCSIFRVATDTAYVKMVEMFNSFSISFTALSLR